MKNNYDSDGARLDALFAVARQAPEPDFSRAEYAFETRLMARLREERASGLAVWAWRLCPFFAVLAISALFWVRTAATSVDRDAPFFSDAGRAGEEQILADYITGDPHP